ncbi:hypothetical protein [Streptomyces sp. NPDC000405]|uniref:hypothetical protein n=1 Tax=Streptomyces sp. NPDC000405 TaxID=3161033 RepID=UPI00398D3D36
MRRLGALRDASREGAGSEVAIDLVVRHRQLSGRWRAGRGEPTRLRKVAMADVRCWPS